MISIAPKNHDVSGSQKWTTVVLVALPNMNDIKPLGPYLLPEGSISVTTRYNNMKQNEQKRIFTQASRMKSNPGKIGTNKIFLYLKTQRKSDSSSEYSNILEVS